MKSSTMKWRLMGALFFFVLTGSKLFSQVQTARYTNINGNTHAFYEYLPQGYSSGGSYPLIVFLHGLGELGAGNANTLPSVANNGIPRLIRDGRFPTSFNVNGQTFRFIVISPQFVAWPQSTDIKAVIDYAKANYKVDASRIYVTGLSMGGGGTWSAAADATYNKTIAAIVPVCGALYPATFRANAVADSDVPIWATHNSGDPTVPVAYTNDYYTIIKARKPNAIFRKTIFNAGGHDAWSTTYDPNWREDGKNVYEWMLQYSRGGSTPPPANNQSPVANAGVDQAITLPTNTARLSGSGTDPDGSIASYAWAKTSGPAAGTITGANTATPSLSGLTQGTYWYELTVTDNKGATAKDQVAINVLVAANQAPVANAGVDQAITLPTNTARLSGSGTDADGSIASYAWVKTNGPAAGTITGANTATPSLSGLTQGTYWYELTVTDNRGGIAKDQVAINVLASSNRAPVVSAGADVTITLPTAAANVVGTATDSDGWITGALWTQVSGPSTAAITYPAVVNTSITNLKEGTYVFQLRATDNSNNSAADQVTVKVNPAAPGAGNPQQPGVKYVKVNLYAGTNAYNNAQWNNWNVVTNGNNASMKITSAAFKYSDGTASNIKGYLSHSQQVKDNGSGYLSSGAAMAPAEVLRFASYSSITRTLKVTGLTAGKAYGLELYSSRSVSGYTNSFKVNNSTVTVNTYNNGSNKVTFSNLSPDAKGEITIEIQKSSLFNYLNGFTVIETTGSASAGRVAASSTAEGSVAANQEGITEDAIDAGKLGFDTYPNPVVNELRVKLNNQYTGQMTVKVFDRTGALRQEVRSNKAQSVMQVLVPFEKLGTGTYFVTVSVGEWSETKQVVKIK